MIESTTLAVQDFIDVTKDASILSVIRKNEWVMIELSMKCENVDDFFCLPVFLKADGNKAIQWTTDVPECFVSNA